MTPPTPAGYVAVIHAADTMDHEEAGNTLVVVQAPEDEGRLFESPQAVRAMIEEMGGLQPGATAYILPIYADPNDDYGTSPRETI